MQLESGILFQRFKRFLIPVFFRFRYSSKFNENRIWFANLRIHTRAFTRIHTVMFPILKNCADHTCISSLSFSSYVSLFVISCEIYCILFFFLIILSHYDFRLTSLVMPSIELTGAYRRSSGFVRLSALRYKSSKKLAHLPVSRRPPAFLDHIFRSLPPPLTIPTLSFFLYLSVSWRVIYY